MQYTFTRLEARVIPEDGDGRKNVVTSLIVGLNARSEDGLNAYRDAEIHLPSPTAEDWVPFEDIDEEWCLAIAERAVEEKKWKEGMEREIEGKKSAPVHKLLSFQIKREPSE